MKRPILHLVPHLSGGGMERRMGIIAKNTNNNFPIHIAFISKGLNYKDIDLGKAIIHKIEARNNYDLKILLRLFFLIISLRPKIIQTWSIQMDILGGFLCFIFRIKHILMEPISPDDDNPKRFDLKIFIKEIFAKNSIIVSNSEIAKLYWNSRKVRLSLLIRNGFDIKSIKNSKGNPLSKDLEDFLNNSEFLVIASRLSETSIHKRTELVISTFAKIIKKKPKLKLVICGDGPLSYIYKELVAKKKIKSKVFFTGFLKRNELWSVFHKASLFISLSKYEGMSNSLIEAGLCKVPLFLSKITTHLEVIPFEYAYYIDQYDQDSLSQEIIKCLENKKKNSEKSILLSKILEKYSSDYMIKSYLELYDRIYQNIF